MTKFILVRNAKVRSDFSDGILPPLGPDPPAFTLHPQSAAASDGDTVTFTVTATGASSYQWQLDSGSGFANISGATSASYTTPVLTAADSGNVYRCVATGLGGSTTSNSATLTVFDYLVESQADFDALPVIGAGETAAIATDLSLAGSMQSNGDVIAYGTGSPPRITSFVDVDVAWTQNGSYPDVYEIDWDVSLIGSNISRLVLLVDDQFIPRAADLLTCALTPGTYYNDNTNIGSDADDLRKVYYHPSGSTNPNTDGRTVSITKYPTLITAGGNTTVRGIELDGNADDNGSLWMTQNKGSAATPGEPQTVDRMLLRRGTKHNCLIGSGVVSKTCVHLVDDVIPAQPATGMLGIFESNVTGLGLEVRNTHIVGTESSVARKSGNATAMTMHSNDSTYYDTFRWYGGSLKGLSDTTIGAAETVAECDGLFVDRCAGTAAVANLFPSSALSPCIMRRIMVRMDLPLAQIIAGNVYGRTYTTWTDCAFATLTYNGSVTPMWQFLQPMYWTFDNCAFINIDNGLGSVFFNGSGTGDRQVTLNKCVLYTGGYRAGYALTSIGGTRNLIVTNTTNPPTNVDNFDYNVNLWVKPSNVTSYLGVLGLTTTGNTATDIANFINAVFLNGRTTGVASGDFRLAEAVGNLQFPDGEYLGDHNIGPQTYWDHNAGASAAGAPSVWPTCPITLAECRQFIADPDSWNFYP